MTLRAGILSDTHLSEPDSLFFQQVEHCFAGCDTIIHAGDLTGLLVLQSFHHRTIYAVRGNCCTRQTGALLPERLVFSLGSFTCGLTHGYGLGHDLEDALWQIFPEADCIIYGHTHRTVCHRQGGVLFINPGAFRPTGSHGAPGTYAILEAGTTLQCTLHEVPRP